MSDDDRPMLAARVDFSLHWVVGDTIPPSDRSGVRSTRLVMRMSFIAVVAVFSTMGAAGCRTSPGAPSPTPMPPLMTTPDNASASASATVGEAAPPSPVPAPPSSAELVLPGDGGSGRFQELEVTVVDITEKRLMDGGDMMRVTLRLRAAGKDETVSITSDEPKRQWQGYELEYRGGWRKEVQLTIRRLSP